MRYHGGKWLLAPKIIAHFPAHQLYVEPFGGAASVLLRKEASPHEVYNDLDSEIYNLMACLRDKRQDLIQAIHYTPYAEKTLSDVYEAEPTQDTVEAARRILVKAMMGRSSASATQKYKATFRGLSVGREIRDCSDEWARYEETLWSVGERLRRVVLRNTSAIHLIKELDHKDALFYVDPPYVPSTRDKGADYKHELTLDDHRHLAETLNSIQGQAILSGYACDEYAQWYEKNRWRRLDFQTQADNSEKRTESIWLSPNIRQTSLFEF
jgi:DNA adenine methylase